MGVKHSVSYQSGENMAKKNDEELYDAAIAMIGSVTKLPAIRVDRDAFLRQQFADSEYLDEILEHGPQYVYTVESLRRKADEVIKQSTNRTTLAAFVAGIPGGGRRGRRRECRHDPILWFCDQSGAEDRLPFWRGRFVLRRIGAE